MFRRTRTPEQKPPLFLPAQGFEKRFYRENITRCFGEEARWKETVQMSTGREGFEIRTTMNERVCERLIAHIQQECQRAYEQLLLEQRRSPSPHEAAHTMFDWHFPYERNIAAATGRHSGAPNTFSPDTDMTSAYNNSNRMTYNGYSNNSIYAQNNSNNRSGAYYDNDTFNVAYHYPGYASAAALAGTPNTTVPTAPPPLRSTSYRSYSPPSDHRISRSAPVSPVVDPLVFSPAQHYVFSNFDMYDIKEHEQNDSFQSQGQDNSMWEPEGGYLMYGEEEDSGSEDNSLYEHPAPRSPERGKDKGDKKKIPEVRIHRVPTLPKLDFPSLDLLPKLKLRGTRSADSLADLAQFWPVDMPLHYGRDMEERRLVESPPAID